jgi:hypothetical protein
MSQQQVSETRVIPTLRRLDIKVFEETQMINSSWLVRAIQTVLKETELPSLEDIAKQMVNVRACRCLQHIPIPKLEIVLCYVLQNFTRFRCRDVSLVHRYLEAGSELPSLNTLKELGTRNQRKFQLVKRLQELGVNIDEECILTPEWSWVFRTADCIWKANPLFTIRHLVQEMLKGIRIAPSLISLETQEIIMYHILKTFSRVKPIDVYYIAAYYVAAEKELPTQEMLHDTMRCHEELMRTPQAYCANNRVHIPTPNLQCLTAIRPQNSELQEHESCAICQNDISKSHWVYKLPVCGHMFHSRGLDCLGTDNSAGYTVRNWLQTSKYCPVCRAEVSIHPQTRGEEDEAKREMVVD